jgi:predicted nucleotidyltransferase
VTFFGFTFQLTNQEVMNLKSQSVTSSEDSLRRYRQAMKTTFAEISRQITRIILAHYPDVQGIYLFGSFHTDDEWPDSDVDLALLLPPLAAKLERNLALSGCAAELADLLGKDVDLLNVRTVSTVFKKEIVAKGRLLYCGDRYAVDEFEMLTLSSYQKLNEERGGIIEAALADGRFYDL